MTCATELVYDWLLEQGKLVRTPESDRFVEAVRNLDTWRWKALGDNVAKQVNDLFYIYGREEFLAWLRPQIEILPKPLAWLRRKIGLNFPALSKEDMAVLEARQRDIDRYVEEKQAQLRIATLCGRQCGVVFAENYFSTLGNKLALDNHDIDFVVMIDMARSAVSYRGVRDDIDLGQIAKQFGGGGHPQAAGSKFVIGDEFWRAIFG
jgi:oligoribonuclease NrnB/cAMP/cGMP phosphodiesterase (DHH superfamily)